MDEKASCQHDKLLKFTGIFMVHIVVDWQHKSYSMAYRNMDGHSDLLRVFVLLILSC